MKLTLDTDSQVFFYEQEFYVLSNFSAFSVEYENILFPTLEHAYHWHKFKGTNPHVAYLIKHARSAHDAFTIAQEFKGERRSDWDEVKLKIMKDLIILKMNQHPYVRKKLKETGNREIIENSWRDSYWGWGPDRNGLNMLGKIWMEVRKDFGYE